MKKKAAGVQPERSEIDRPAGDLTGGRVEATGRGFFPPKSRPPRPPPPHWSAWGLFFFLAT